MFLILLTSATVILSRLALFLTLLHFIWTVSEIHARIAVMLWLTSSVFEILLKYVILKGDKK